MRPVANETSTLGWSRTCLPLAFALITLTLSLLSFAFAFPLITFALAGLNAIQLLLDGLIRVPGSPLSIPAVVLLSGWGMVGLIGPKAYPRSPPLDISFEFL